jgi:hypothetical protein
MLHSPNRATATITAILLASTLCALPAQTTRISKASATALGPRAVLVELFTSEGFQVDLGRVLGVDTKPV